MGLDLLFGLFHFSASLLSSPRRRIAPEIFLSPCFLVARPFPCVAKLFYSLALFAQICFHTSQFEPSNFDPSAPPPLLGKNILSSLDFPPVASHCSSPNHFFEPFSFWFPFPPLCLFVRVFFCSCAAGGPRISFLDGFGYPRRRRIYPFPSLTFTHGEIFPQPSFYPRVLRRPDALF